MNNNKIKNWYYLLLLINLILLSVILFLYQNKIKKLFGFAQTHLSKKEITAYHEAGHALIYLKYPKHFSVEYATIKPTKKALGHVKFRQIFNNPDEMLLGVLGGTASEHLLAKQNKMDPKQVGKGSGSDYRKAKQIISKYKIDKNLTFFLNKSQKILQKNQKILDRIAQNLIQKTTLSQNNLQNIIKSNGSIILD